MALVFTAWAIWIFTRFYLGLFHHGLDFSSLFPTLPQEGAPPDLFQRFLRLFGFFGPIGTGLLCVGIFWAFGKRFFCLLGLVSSGPIRSLLEMVMGSVLADWCWLGLGLTGLWSWVPGVVILFGGALLLLKDLLALRGRRWKAPVLGGWDLAMAGVLWVYAVFLLLQDLLPETFYDSLNYFLGLPAYWWSRHGIVDQPLHILSGYFHGGSLIYWGAFLLGGGQGAKVLAGLFLLGTALLGWAWAGEWGDKAQRWSTAMAVLTFPLLYLNAWATRVDSLLTLVVLLFFYCVQKILEGRQTTSWMTLGGILAGQALSIKPTAIVPVLGGVAMILLVGQGKRLRTQAAWTWGGLFFLEAGPWLLKNAVYTGDPFFPYLANRLGARSIPVFGYHRLLQENQQFLPMDHGLSSWLTLPWRLTMPDSGDGQFLGPLLLAVLPILLVVMFRKSSLRPLALVFWVSAVTGLGLSHMLRFSLPVFTLGLLLAGAFFSTFGTGRWKWLWPCLVLLNAVLCFPELLSLSAQWSSGVPFWTGHEDQGQYLSRRLGRSDMEMCDLVDRNLPPDSRILFIGDSRVLYYDRQVLAQSTFDEPFFVTALREGKDEAGILKKLKEFGITHVIVHQGLGSLYSKEYHQYDALTPSDWRLLERFAQGGLEPVVLEGSLGLFRVRDHWGSPDPKSPNLFSLLPSPAADCLAALNQGERVTAEKGIARMLELFPRDPFWLAQERVLSGRSGKKVEP